MIRSAACIVVVFFDLRSKFHVIRDGLLADSPLTCRQAVDGLDGGVG